MTFTIVTSGEDPSVLLLDGELDLATLPQLNDRVDRLVEVGRTRILLDLSGLSFCDSTGLGGFVRGNNLCTDAGGWLRVVGANGGVARVLAATGLDRFLAPEPQGARPTGDRAGDDGAGGNPS
ncbi:STAS domain-containing protein [Micromonospora sp. NBC_01699]|uniref:STAS domain-containing protein n=1 Tax=Micromonospora sp. NBC_01699 TaxID=2975984 RepID=UPI002E2AE089|nr:STAS domain-containing protein [Micromonospora sp. NBC_01699]